LSFTGFALQNDNSHSLAHKLNTASPTQAKVFDGISKSSDSLYLLYVKFSITKLYHSPPPFAINLKQKKEQLCSLVNRNFV